MTGANPAGGPPRAGHGRRPGEGLHPFPSRALRIAGAYALFGSLWIVFSDRLVARITGSPLDITRFQTLKGWAFVAVTAALVYLLVRASTSSLLRTARRLRESEDELRRRTEFIETVLQSLPVGVAVHPVESGAFRYLNHRFAQICGWPASLLTTWDEALGRMAADLREGETLTYRPEALSVRGSTGETARVQVSIVTQGGDERRIALHQVSLEDQGLLVTVVEDLTERLRAEAERERLEGLLRQSQKMEALGRLAGGVAHDFNNILSVVLGYSDLIAARLGPADPLVPPLEAIRKAGEQAAALTRQLLVFSRSQTPGVQVVDACQSVRDVEELLHRLLGKGIRLARDLPPHPLAVRIDPAQLQQVLMNLVLNARDAMEGRGTLTLRGRSVPASGAGSPQADPPGRKEVVLEVADTGPGMTAEVAGRVFDPFFTTKEPGRGTGLGLFLVHGIVTQQGGRVEVETEPGRGSTFRIHLPAAQEPPTAAAREPWPPDCAARGETVLVVEDEASVRELTARILESCGYRVLEAEDGASALDLAGRHPGPIHLLLTDLHMPGLGGSQIYERLSGQRAEIRVLYLSGHPNGAKEVTGADGQPPLLQKPFTLHRLVAAVRDALDSPRPSA